MTEDYKPTDNAIAERVNGIIKTYFLEPFFAVFHEPIDFQTLDISCIFLRYYLVIALTITYPKAWHIHTKTANLGVRHAIFIIDSMIIARLRRLLELQRGER